RGKNLGVTVADSLTEIPFPPKATSSSGSSVAMVCGVSCGRSHSGTYSPLSARQLIWIECDGEAAGGGRGREAATRDGGGTSKFSLSAIVISKFFSRISLFPLFFSIFFIFHNGSP